MKKNKLISLPIDQKVLLDLVYKITIKIHNNNLIQIVKLTKKSQILT